MASLPIVDLRSFSSEKELAAELMRVGKDPGFFYVIGHNIGDDVTAPIFKLAEAFFDTSFDHKKSYHDGSGDLVSNGH